MYCKEVEIFLEQGKAFIPVNLKDRGDSVQLYLADGSVEILDMQSKVFFKLLLGHFGTSVSMNRNRYGKLVGKKQLVPVVLSYGVTLIPYNVRESIEFGKQSRIGWFIAGGVSGIRQSTKSHTIIELGEHKIPVLHSERFCFDQLKNARCIELSYSQIHEPHRRKWIY